MILPSYNRIYGFSNSAIIFSVLVAKWVERNPLSNCIPSTISIEVSIPLDSSTVITPSLPTLSNASEISFPMFSSPFADIVAICSTLSPTLIDCLSNSDTTTSTALSIPLLRYTGLVPASTNLNPSEAIAWASTVAVVVPSPASSAVFCDTSLTNWTPIFI